MRAVVVREGRLAVEDREKPTPAAGEVLVRVRGCGICGSDLHYVKHGAEFINIAKSLGVPTSEMERAQQEGVVLGHEFVGEIVEFGPGTEQNLKVGDRVCSMPFRMKAGAPVLIGSNPETGGAYAEYMTLTEAMLLKVDEGVSDDAAALVEPIGIAVHAVNKGAVVENDIAVVVGSGPIGLAVIAVLKMRGVRAIYAADLSARRRGLAKTLGADVVVDGRVESIVLRAAAEQPGAPTVIFENTGAKGMLGRLVVEAPQNARLVVTGISTGNESLLPMAAIIKELSINFVIYYSPDEFAQSLAAIRDEEINWRPMISGRISLEDVPMAFQELQDPERHAKLIVDPSLRA